MVFELMVSNIASERGLWSLAPDAHTFFRSDCGVDSQSGPSSSDNEEACSSKTSKRKSREEEQAAEAGPAKVPKAKSRAKPGANVKG